MRVRLKCCQLIYFCSNTTISSVLRYHIYITYQVFTHLLVWCGKYSRWWWWWLAWHRHKRQLQIHWKVTALAFCALCWFCSSFKQINIWHILYRDWWLGRRSNKLKDFGGQLVAEQWELTYSTRWKHTVWHISARVLAIPWRLYNETEQWHYLLVGAVTQTSMCQYALYLHLPQPTAVHNLLSVNVTKRQLNEWMNTYIYITPIRQSPQRR